MIKTLFDTSVVVASFVKAHPRHSNCLPWMQQVRNGTIQGVLATHTLAETYAVLTRLPLAPRISPKLAQHLISENLGKFEVVSLTSSDYQMVVAKMVTLNLTGGAIYDALIAQVAEKSQVARLLTLNPDHFTRLGEPLASRVQVPQ